MMLWAGESTVVEFERKFMDDVRDGDQVKANSLDEEGEGDFTQHVGDVELA